MAKPTIKLAFDKHRNIPMVRLFFDKDQTLISMVKTIKGMILIQSQKFCVKEYLWGNNKDWLGYESHKVTAICTHEYQKDFAKFKNSFDDIFFDDG